MGKRSLVDLVAPAISMAEEGVQWTPVAAALTREAETLLRQWNGRLPYLPDDRLPIAGERLQVPGLAKLLARSEEHTSELQSLMRISYAVFCLIQNKVHPSEP